MIYLKSDEKSFVFFHVNFLDGVWGEVDVGGFENSSDCRMRSKSKSRDCWWNIMIHMKENFFCARVDKLRPHPMKLVEFAFDCHFNVLEIHQKCKHHDHLNKKPNFHLTNSHICHVQSTKLIIRKWPGNVEKNSTCIHSAAYFTRN